MAQQLRAPAFSEDPSSGPCARQAAGNSTSKGICCLLLASVGICTHHRHTHQLLKILFKKIKYVAHEGLGNGSADKSICLAGKRSLV